MLKSGKSVPLPMHKTTWCHIPEDLIFTAVRTSILINEVPPTVTKCCYSLSSVFIIFS